MNAQDSSFTGRHSPLRQDIEALGALLRQVLQEQSGDELLSLFEQDHETAARGRAGAGGAFEALSVRVRGRQPRVARELVRAFSSWFQLTNLAERVHRIRRRREYFRQDQERPQPGGVEDALSELKAAGLGLEEMLQLLAQLSIEPVLMAHPIESARRTTLRRQQRVAGLLLDRDNQNLAPHEQRALLERVRTEVSIDWQTEEHPRERLTVADEREHAIFYLAEILYRIIPAFYQEIAAGLARLYGVSPETIELPVIVRFGTWVGGDMEDSPDVHAKSIRETLLRAQQVIINNYFEECQKLAQTLSQSARRVGVSPELASRLEEYRILLPGAPGMATSRHDRMPYRALLVQIAERLHATYDGRARGYQKPAQFRADIALIAQSLLAHRGAHAGYFQVRRLLARIDTFGFHLATLDLKAHTSVHHAVLAQGLDDPQWPTRTPAERHARLIDVLERDLAPTGPLNALGKRTLAVFDAIVQCRHRYGDDAIGLYIVSAAAEADDVLAPLVLARWAEAYDKSSGQVALDVAPQFDSVATLKRCGDVMRELLGDAVYKRHLESRGSRQTVLIGYSRSSQESGMIASRHAAYCAQRLLTSALDQAREQHVLIHSRGGSVPRGGGRIDSLLRAAPAETINGVLRFTEQGEGISQNYGLRPNAMRTLERAFSTLSRATLAVKRGVAVPEGTALAQCAAVVAEHSERSWCRLVLEQPQFADYFRAVTPIDVIERMQIGAQVAPGAERRALQAVRPTAWVFAWAQSRHMLPGWYGAGTGLGRAVEERGLDLLRDCYRGWPFFQNLINDTEAMLARTDMGIAAHYDRLAAPELRHYGTQLREEYERCVQLVLQIKECTALLDTDRTLQRAIALRNPYVDPMNLMQVELLERWRASGRQNRELFEALQASVSGMARGLQLIG